MNYASLVQAIQDTTESNEATFVSNIPVFVKQAEQVIYATVQLPVLRSNATGTLTTNNRYLTVPVDFLAPYGLAVIDAQGLYSWLYFKDSEWMLEAYPDPAVKGKPKYYALFDSTTFILGRTPDAGYTAEIHYYRFPASIVDAGTSWVGDNYDSVLLYGALTFASAFLKLETDLVTLYDSKFKESLSVLKKIAEGMDRTDAYKEMQTKIAVK